MAKCARGITHAAAAVEAARRSFKSYHSSGNHFSQLGQKQTTGAAAVLCSVCFASACQPPLYTSTNCLDTESQTPRGCSNALFTAPCDAAAVVLLFLLQVGDSVAPGDMLCEVETDKATIAWESQEEGFIAALLLPDGAKEVAVGAPAAVIVEEQVRVDHCLTMLD
jgi:hypothetical protein